MMEFLAANFNLPTIIVSIFVFGGTGWLLYHEHKTGGLGCCDGSCGGGGCGSLGSGGRCGVRLGMAAPGQADSQRRGGQQDR